MNDEARSFPGDMSRGHRNPPRRDPTRSGRGRGGLDANFANGAT